MQKCHRLGALCAAGQDAFTPEWRKKRERATVSAKMKEGLATKRQDVIGRMEEEEGNRREGRVRMEEGGGSKEERGRKR